VQGIVGTVQENTSKQKVKIWPDGRHDGSLGIAVFIIGLFAAIRPSIDPFVCDIIMTRLVVFLPQFFQAHRALHCIR
jgi:hypothetical protein